MQQHLFRAGAAAQGRLDVDLSPARAGWTYSGLGVVSLAPGESIRLDTGEFEYLVLPLEGGATVFVDGESFELTGRRSVFGETTDYLYAPSGSSIEVTSEAGGRYALPYALAAERLAPRYCPAGEVVVATRGAGNMSRQVANYALGNELHTSRLLVCEVLTPGGNWSSYPPHKHDTDTADENELEEIYYFEVEANEHGPGFGLHATYASDERPIDVAAMVRSGDVALVPHGWHGPCAAAPGFTLYYLNVMAGPGEAEWKSVDDPGFGWLRDTWPELQPDPRLPIVVKEA